jgi:hypothetical protein
MLRLSYLQEKSFYLEDFGAMPILSPCRSEQTFKCLEQVGGASLLMIRQEQGVELPLKYVEVSE